MQGGSTLKYAVHTVSCPGEHSRDKRAGHATHGGARHAMQHIILIIAIKGRWTPLPQVADPPSWEARRAGAGAGSVMHCVCAGGVRGGWKGGLPYPAEVLGGAGRTAVLRGSWEGKTGGRVGWGRSYTVMSGRARAGGAWGGTCRLTLGPGGGAAGRSAGQSAGSSNGLRHQ
jgi:hypothetical protein